MKKIISTVLFLIPGAAFAQSLAQINTLATGVGGIVNTLIPIVMLMAVLVFFWGLVKYIASASDEANKESGKTLMIWGMIALFVMVALWGILGWVQNNLGLTGTVVSSAPPAFVVPTT